MNGIDRRQLVLAGLVAGGAGLGWLRQPVLAQPVWAHQSLANLVPRHFAGWSGSADEARIVLPDADDRAIDAVYDDRLARIYRGARPGAVLMVITTALRQSGNLHVHRPEQCYPAAGFRITADRAVPLRSGGPAVARFLTAQCEDRIEQVLYWIRIGGGFALSAAQEQWLVTGAALAGTLPEGVLVRVSVVTADAIAALAMLRGFVGDLCAAAQGAARDLLVHG